MELTNVSTLTLTFKQETWFEATAHILQDTLLEKYGLIWPKKSNEMIKKLLCPQFLFSHKLTQYGRRQNHSKPSMCGK